MTPTDNLQEDELYTYDSFGNPPRKRERPTTHFLWWCAGAYQHLLRKFPSEYSKYSGLGGVILATFVLASLSSGYAIHSVFGNWLWTFSFALIWGLIIFNFDRFLVSTMRKYGITRRKQIWMAVPRLGLALLIGLTIARPLELKIFEKEINVKMIENLHQKVQRNDSLLNLENESLVQVATNERQRLTERKQAIEDTLHSLQTAYVQEADGTGGSMQRGIDNLTRLKQDAYQKAQLRTGPEMQILDQAIRTQDSILNTARSGLEEKRKVYEAGAKANMGFLERNKALSDLADQETSVWWTTLLISLLIILIEIGPVLSKLIMPVGPYDIALARDELLQMASDENEIRKGKEIINEKRKSFYQRQKQGSEEIAENGSHPGDMEKWKRV